MAGGRGGAGADEKHSLQILWALAGITIIGVIIWWRFGLQLKTAFLQWRLWQLQGLWWLAQYIPDNFPISWVLKWKADLAFGLDLANNLDASELTSVHAALLSNLIGRTVQIPAVILLVFFAYKSYVGNIKTKFRKRYDMTSLSKQESSLWPQINPVMGLDLVSTPLNEGPWAMAKTPLMFCKHYKLIKVKAEPPRKFGQGVSFTMTLDKERTERVLAAQLGRVWSRPDYLPMYKQALLAAFIARGCRDTPSAQKLLAQINQSADSSKPGVLNFTGADKLWQKHINDKLVQQVIGSHAYEYTVFMALFAFARQDGVFACADFLWLKPVDREFWFVLSNVGRQTAFAEAAGPFAHFLAEKALQRPLSVPFVQEGVKAMQVALDEVIYIPEQDEREQLIAELQAAN